MPTLDWIGKKAVVDHHRKVPFHLLRENPELSVGDPSAGNLLVQGDNLLALKALLPYYAGQVKCIYIDPPYNTGNEGWVYNDNVNSPEIRRWLGEVVGREAEDLSRHDKWLCMMYPRLMLLKEFLREDGAIFVSIDDVEVALLRVLMDEVFGRASFVATLIWQKRTSRENRAAIGSSHDYILVYAPAGPQEWKKTRNLLPDTGKGYSNPDNDPRGPWRSIPFSAQGYRPNQMYEIMAPAGNKLRPPKGRCWGATEPVFMEYLAEGRVYFPNGGRGRPRIKKYLYEERGLVPNTLWFANEVGDNQEAKKELLAIFPDDEVFATPKPIRLIQQILRVATNPGDLVLDSFAGSGTTGHAVMALNRENAAEEPRRFILCEMEDMIARDITAVRLRRASEGYGDTPGLGGGFRYCELGPALFDGRGQINEEVSFEELARYIFFAETGTPLPEGALNGTPFLGAVNGTGVYLLYNGILKDKQPGGGNVLTRDVLASLPPFEGKKVVYGTSRRVSEDTLRRAGVVFRQIPYQLQTR